ncbi:amidohydrolase family protein [Micromonospora sp. WMMC250]|uniref:amidohydrolase family protein n=1 Tax=Micromonospora sp. WMMC250 TaxID=3014781 RepID=UPI0022B679A6|nr:amidohydrolase family protein [Micromonospora sp. WMMC250]MCZ7373630.1 amidohydrolase family protein [Micromonospora sp. WMMC250]
MYQPAIDLDTVTAIDMHVHIEVDDHGHASLPEPLVAAASAYFRTDGPRPAVGAVAQYYRERSMAAVVFTVDARTQLRHQPLSSADIARAAAEHADVLIPFGSVDPRTGEAALDLATRLIEEEGVRGFKFHPTVQGFDPSHDEYAPLWGLLERAGVPALFHTGQTGIGAGTPGGYGLRLGLSNPILLDPIAADFPDLQIIMAHPSVPWQDEALSVATHKHNTWIDLSGWSPKYFPAELVRYANSVLKRRVLFGTDYPLLTPDRWLHDVQTTDLKPDVLPGILKDNAARLLGLAR